MSDEQSGKKDVLSEPSRVKGNDTDQEIELNLDLSYEVLALYFEAILPEVGEATRLHMAKAISKNHSRLITEARIETVLLCLPTLSPDDARRLIEANQSVKQLKATLKQSGERKQV